MSSYDKKCIKRFAIKSSYYFITLASLALAAWALYYAFRCVDIHFAYWVVVYVAVAIYLLLAVKFIRSRKRGFYKFLAHSALLQLIPLVASISTFCLVPRIPNNIIAQEKQEEFGPYKPLQGKVSTYERAFNDMQDVQKRAALANGLPPFESRAQIEEQYRELRRDKKLVKIETNSKYVVRPLTYSSPYVVPKVERLLEDLADLFQQKMQSNTRFMVTSVLRTEEDIKKLKRVNGNASSASCHCNATTIDISYARFDQDVFLPRDGYQLRLALAQALYELRKEGRCYVKRERKQYCYHITVR